MHIDVDAAADQLEELAAIAEAGFDVVITREGMPAARLMVVAPGDDPDRVPAA
jgi:antitoxin (DNA-binding transcriptional repressor) of toxin-antitoxin stability system